MPTCRLCKRDCAPSSELCKYHLRAKMSVESGYKQWSESYGEMTWNAYLLKIIKNKETGLWAKEVAQMLASGSTT